MMNKIKFKNVRTNSLLLLLFTQKLFSRFFFYKNNEKKSLITRNTFFNFNQFKTSNLNNKVNALVSSVDRKKLPNQKLIKFNLYIFNYYYYYEYFSFIQLLQLKKIFLKVKNFPCQIIEQFKKTISFLNLLTFHFYL